MIYFQIIYLTSANPIHLMTKVTSVLRLHYKMDVFLINISLELSYAHPPIEIIFKTVHKYQCY